MIITVEQSCLNSTKQVRGGGQGGNKRDYRIQISVICSHDESGNVFVSQWDVDLQGVWLFKFTIRRD